MQVKIQGVGIKLTDALKDYVNDKFKKLERKAELVNSINITLTVDNLTHIAKADVAVTGDSLHTEAEAVTMYAAIDGLIDKVDRQLVKYKEKLKD